MAFSASEAAFEGFHIVRREPKSVAIWGLLLMVFSAAATIAMLPFMRSATTGFGLTPGSPPTTAAMGSFLSLMGAIYLIGIPIYLVLMSVFTAAVYRAVLRPEDKGLARLKLGGDELRLVGLFVLQFLTYLALWLAVVVVAAIVGAIAATALRGAGAGAVIVLLIVYLLVLLAFAFVAVRLSFAAPMTFARRKIHFFSAWRLTEGRFWPLLGCYLLALVFAILIGLVDLAVSGVLAFGMSGGDFTRAAHGLLQPDLSSAAGLFTPMYIARLLVGAVFGVVIWTVMIAAPAAAYREIAGPRPQDQAEAFT